MDRASACRVQRGKDRQHVILRWDLCYCIYFCYKTTDVETSVGPWRHYQWRSGAPAPFCFDRGEFVGVVEPERGFWLFPRPRRDEDRAEESLD